MDLSIFVSATCTDLDDDCRPAVVAAIERERAHPIDMSKWTADHRPALEVCLGKLERDATHYVGVFAFWHGWIPQGERESITQAEYRHALHCKKPAIVFLPKPESDIERQLRLRAESANPPQSVEHQSAQERFREEVLKSGVVTFFPTPWDLALQVGEQVQSWRDGHLLSLGPETGSPLPIPEHEICLIGMDDQLAAFDRCLAACEPEARIAFVVHGPPCQGHAAAMKALCLRLEETRAGTPRRLTARVASAWGGKCVRNLVWGLASSIRQDFKPTKLSQLASELLIELRESDLILEISDVEQFPGGIDAFRESFWSKLIQAMNRADVESKPNDLIAILGHGDVLASGTAAEAAAPDAAREAGALLVLPALSPVDENRLLQWLRRWIEDVDRAREITRKVFDQTEGVLEAVHAQLLDSGLWETSGVIAEDVAWEDDDWEEDDI